MWSAEGTAWMELAQQLPEKVTGLATNVQTGTLWITCNTPTPIVLDARTGTIKQHSIALCIVLTH